MLLETFPSPAVPKRPPAVPRKSRATVWRALLVGNALALLGVAIWFRVWRLESVPGVNGDEAWLGVQVQLWLRGEPIAWRTPTNNLINPFLFFPQALGHAVFRPSFAVLRMPAVISGLLAIAVNFVWCRRHFGQSAAVLSTLLLAILPLNIAYSRFAWDASQSLLASLIVLYLTLEALRAPEQRVRHLLGVCTALAAAVLVHPTNVFLAPMALVPCGLLWRTELRTVWRRCRQPRYALAAALCLLLAGGIAYTVAGRWLHVAMARLLTPAEIPQFLLNYTRLLSGTTVYQFIAGSHAGFGSTLVDLLIGAGVLAAYFGFWKRAKRDRNATHLLLLVGWALSMFGFYLVAGPGAMAPHFERYSIWLIGPSCLLLTLAVSPLLVRRDAAGRAAQLVALSLAWCVLADFNSSYFQRFAETGGGSHPAFRTAATEPKLAALQHILRATSARSQSDPVWIIATQWWNYWPIRYLALAEPDVHVESWSAANERQDFRQALRAGRVWCVEFSGGAAHARAKKTLMQSGIDFSEQTICDPTGSPILSLMNCCCPDYGLPVAFAR